MKFKGRGDITPSSKRIPSREAQNAPNLMKLHTHKIWEICGSEKKKAPILVEKSGRGEEIKKAAKTFSTIVGFETESAKSNNIVLHDAESFRPKKLNIKIKEWNIFSYEKRISRLRCLCAEKFKFSWKAVTEIDLQKRQVFSSNFEFFQFFFHFHNQSQVFTTTGQKYDRYMTTAKRNI